MTRERLSSMVKELSKRALLSGNPYKKLSINFFIDREPRFIYGDKVYTEKDLDEAYLETARKDIKKGYLDRKTGYYDKWYRYNRADEGRAYDLDSKSTE